jgi:predicted nucleic acid-binding protein
MSYLIDTNVVSELTRSTPNNNVIKWFEETPIEHLYVSVLTLTEIRKGVEAVEDMKRKQKLKAWLEIDLLAWFDERILAIDISVAERWGRLQYEVQRSVPVIDSLLAATALHHNLCIVTRNVKDFDYYHGLELFNPF